jgi:hypothetical protein
MTVGELPNDKILRIIRNNISDARIDPRRLDRLECENTWLRGEVRKYKNIADIAQSAYVQKSKIAEILFENQASIPEGLYLELMNNLK